MQDLFGLHHRTLLEVVLLECCALIGCAYATVDEFRLEVVVVGCWNCAHKGERVAYAALKIERSHSGVWRFIYKLWVGNGDALLYTIVLP